MSPTRTPSVLMPLSSSRFPLLAAEGFAHVTLLVLQAPLPSSERVASAVDFVMDMSKRGLRSLGRESYYYIQVGTDRRGSRG